MSVSTKVENLYGELKRRIGTLGPGSRVPSVRELVKEYQVSLMTADRAMGRLTTEGLVVRRVGKGTFVAGTSDPAEVANRSATISIAVLNYSSPIWDSLVTSLVQAVEARGHQSRVIRYEEQNLPLLFRGKDGSDGMLLILPGYDMSPDDLARLGGMNKPLVLIDRIFRGVSVDCVGTDHELGGAILAEHLIQLGHRKLAVLFSEPHFSATESRVNGFCRRAHLAGIDDIRIIDCHTVSGQSSLEKAHDAMAEYLASNEIDFTALFISSDGSALGAIKAFQRAGIAIPDRVSLVGYDDIPQALYYHPSLTTIQHDLTVIAEKAVGAILHRLTGQKGKAIQHAVAPKLVVRDSTRMCVT